MITNVSRQHAAQKTDQFAVTVHDNQIDHCYYYYCVLVVALSIVLNNTKSDRYSSMYILHTDIHM